MIRIAAHVGGLAVIAGLLCLPAVWSDDASAAGRPDLPWTPRWDPVLGTSTGVLLVVLALGVVATVVAGRLGERAGERGPAYVRTDVPPDGLGPAQVSHVLGQPVLVRAYVGTLLHAARLGAVVLRREEADWVVSAAGEPVDPAVDAVTRQAYEPLLADAPTFRISPSSASVGEALAGVLGGVRREARAWGVTSGTMSRTGLAGGCAWLAALGVVLVLACLLQPFGMSMLGVLPGALVVGALSAAEAGSGARHTRRGRRLWARAGGFREVLAEPSSRVRFGFAGREGRYADHVSWAVAFGVTRQWAAKFRTEVGTEPPVPGYVGEYDGENPVDHVEAAVHSLTSAVNGALATYTTRAR